jgi:hypothetical protein
MMQKVIRVSALVAIAVVCVAASGLAQTVKTPGQVFLEYRATFEKAKAVDEILPFMSKETKAEIAKSPAAERKQMFSMMQAMSDARGVKVVKETKNDKGVELDVEGTTPDKKKSTGKIQMVKEDGAWKVSRESWQ